MVGRVAAYLALQSRTSIILSALVLVAFIGLLDFATGFELRLGVLYVAPVSLASWYADRLSGALVAFISGIASLLADLASGVIYHSHPAFVFWNTATLIGFLILLAVILARLKMAYETLESLIQTVAHDLKSPVISVVGLVRSLRRRCSNLPPDEKRALILEQLESSGERMERFLKELLDGLASDHVTPVLQHALIDQIVNESVQQHLHSMEERGIDVRVEVAPNLGPVRVDPHRIRQVVDNLLLNAVRYMGDGPDPVIKIQVRDHRRSVITIISDNGVGIPAEHIGKIFDRFFRVPRSDAKPGTGLGLSIAKKIIDSHGGRIWVESETGRGTSFFFTLPKSKQ